MQTHLIEKYRNSPPSQTEITPLFEECDHSIYWLGTMEETAFRCNSYLIKDGREALIVDPGSRHSSEQLQQRVAQILPPEQVTGLILCHQDPDVAASMVDWLEINPRIRIITSPRTNVLLPHYGRSDYDFYDIVENPVLSLPSGASLEFIEAPFLHFREHSRPMTAIPRRYSPVISGPLSIWTGN